MDRVNAGRQKSGPKLARVLLDWMRMGIENPRRRPADAGVPISFRAGGVGPEKLNGSFGSAENTG
jgi:hypothetical protein